MHREPRVLEAEAQVGKWVDCRARITSKELAQFHSVKNGISPECLFYKSEHGRKLRDECSYAHRQVDEQPSKKYQNNGDKSAVAMLKVTRQLGCAFQEMEPPKSSSILWKSSNIRKPIRCVKFTKAVLRHANIRDQKPSLGMICPGDPHQRNPNAPKFEDRSQEETERQERDAREAVWKMARCFLKLEEQHKTTFFSSSENWCLPSPSTTKPEEREFVVDSGASMHMISKKDLNCAELENVTTSRSPMTVITASGEVQTNEEATVHVGELEIFLTMKLLEDTPAVLSLGKLCDGHGYSHEWINGQKPHLMKKWYSNTVEYGNFRTNRGSWFVYNFFKLVYLNIHGSFRSGNWSFRSPSSNRVKWKCG